MKKTLSALGPNGQFIGTVMLRKRQVVKQFKTPEGDKGSRKTDVYDVQSFVNGHPFGQVRNNIDNTEIAEIEVKHQEAVLKAHIEKQASKPTGKNLQISLKKLGYEETPVLRKRITKATRVTSDKSISDLNQWIKKNTKKVGLGESKRQTA